MSNSHDVLYCRIHDYVTAELEQAATSQQRRDFAELVCGNETAREIYVAYMQELSSLRWSYANQPLELLDQIDRDASRWLDRPASELGSRSGIPLPWAVALAVTLITVLATAWLIADRGGRQVVAPSGEGPSQEATVGTAVATITRMIDAKWAPGALPPTELSRLRTGQTLNLKAGQVELVFDTGVQVVLQGQTHFEIRTADSAYSRRGSISARVGDEAAGFTIETPNARVVDLGTEFGVSISEDGETEVAVFRGEVDLAPDCSRNKPAAFVSRRLIQGEALRVDKYGELNRMVAIASDYFPSPAADRIPHTGRPPLIEDVRDNIRDPESQKFYKIVRSGLQEDAQAFVDRNHQWNGVDERGMPDQLLGAEYVMPFNDDKFSDNLEVRLSVARPASLYVFLSDNVAVPAWLEANFVDTGKNIGLDEGPSRFHPAKTGRRKGGVGPGQSVDTVFSIWRREIEVPSEVVLGAVDRPDPVTGYNMYGIAAVPLE